jgi:hypothetical protein
MTGIVAGYREFGKAAVHESAFTLTAFPSSGTTAPAPSLVTVSPTLNVQTGAWTVAVRADCSLGAEGGDDLPG